MTLATRNTTKSNDRNSYIEKQKMNKLNSLVDHIANTDNNDVVVLSAKPINITRKVSFIKTAGRLPIMREIIIVETEAPLSRVIAGIASIFVFSLIVLLITSYWQRLSPRSCNIVTNIILFTFPVSLSLYFREYIFAFITVVFFIKLGLIYGEVLRKPSRTETPKKVYHFFTFMYRLCYILTYLSLAFSVIFYVLSIEIIILISLYIVFYGVYFGLIIRESINVISEQMASNVGYYTKEGIPKKNLSDDTCALCDETANNLVRLACKHQYHEKCIKGWLLMGKRNFCPCCRENVDFERLNMNFWDKNDTVYGGMVDNLRNFVIVIFSVFTVALIIK